MVKSYYEVWRVHYYWSMYCYWKFCLSVCLSCVMCCILCINQITRRTDDIFFAFPLLHVSLYQCSVDLNIVQNEFVFQKVHIFPYNANLFTFSPGVLYFMAGTTLQQSDWSRQTKCLILTEMFPICLETNSYHQLSHSSRTYIKISSAYIVPHQIMSSHKDIDDGNGYLLVMVIRYFVSVSSILGSPVHKWLLNELQNYEVSFIITGEWV